MRSLIVHNAKSGFGSDAVFEFERALVSQGDECVLRVLPDGAGAREILSDAESFDLVVASGGDGTITSLLFELRGRDVPTCVFPSGTANLLFKNLGCASEPSAIAHACRQGRTIRTDLGEIGWVDGDGRARTRGFGLMAGSGFDAQIMAAAVPNKKLMGEAAYFAAALANPRPEVARFSITVDGVTHERDGIACIVANNAMIQGEIEVVPNCSMTDGLLDVIVLETSDAMHLLRPVFASLVDRSGRVIGRPCIEQFTGASVQVRSSRPIPLQVDGEAMPGTIDAYDAHVIGGCNRLIVDGVSRYVPNGATPRRPPETSRPSGVAPRP